MVFKSGDVVQLKSGGPRMTVTTATVRGGRQIAICTWFEGSKQVHGTFAQETLQEIGSGPTIA